MIQELDARGISPPLPVLRAHRALRGMPAGQLLKVLTTQPQSVAEFQSLAKYMPQYELVSQEETDGAFVHLLRKRRRRRLLAQPEDRSETSRSIRAASSDVSTGETR